MVKTPYQINFVLVETSTILKQELRN